MAVGAQRLGKYGEVDEAAQERVLKSHLAPTLRMFELVDQDRNGHLGIDKVAAAEQELEKRHEELSKCPPAICALKTLRAFLEKNLKRANKAHNCIVTTCMVRREM